MLIIELVFIFLVEKKVLAYIFTLLFARIVDYCMLTFIKHYKALHSKSCFSNQILD